MSSHRVTYSARDSPLSTVPEQENSTRETQTHTVEFVSPEKSRLN